MHLEQHGEAARELRQKEADLCHDDATMSLYDAAFVMDESERSELRRPHARHVWRH